MFDTVLTGFGFGAGVVYVLSQFGLSYVFWRKYIDFALLILLVFVVITIPTNFVVALTTWAGITISALLRALAWKEQRDLLIARRKSDAKHRVYTGTTYQRRR